METLEKDANKKYDQMVTNHKKEIDANAQVRRMTNELEDSICGIVILYTQDKHV